MFILIGLQVCKRFNTKQFKNSLVQQAELPLPTMLLKYDEFWRTDGLK